MMIIPGMSNNTNLVLSLRGVRNERQSNLQRASVSRRSLRRSAPRDDMRIEFSLCAFVFLAANN